MSRNYVRNNNKWIDWNEMMDGEFNVGVSEWINWLIDWLHWLID